MRIVILGNIKDFWIKFFSNKYYVWIVWLQYNKQMNFVCEHVILNNII